jgi:hypothetical protein
MTSSGSLDNSKHPVGVVFLSHASKDLAFVSEIDRLLKDAGIPSWMAAVEIEPGANYADSIFKTLSLARACVVFLTEDSIASEHVRREVNIAIDQKIKLYPVSLKGSSEIISTLPADWKYWLSITQILTCTDANDAAQALLELFPEVLGTEYSPTTYSLPASAKNWIHTASSQIEHLMNDADYRLNFDFEVFHKDYMNLLAVEFQRLYSSSNLEEKIYIGDLLNNCYNTFISTLDPTNNKAIDWKMVFDNYLKIAALLFSNPWAMITFADISMRTDPDIFIEYVEKEFRYKSVFSNANIMATKWANQFTDENVNWQLQFKNYQISIFTSRSFSLRILAKLLRRSESLAEIEDLINELDALDLTYKNFDIKGLIDFFSHDGILESSYLNLQILHFYLLDSLGFKSKAKQKFQEIPISSAKDGLDILRSQVDNLNQTNVATLFASICSLIETALNKG